jgi:hypothetical protein
LKLARNTVPAQLRGILQTIIYRVKQAGRGSGRVWILAGRQLLLLRLDPLADAGIGALVTGLFQPFNIRP